MPDRIQLSRAKGWRKPAGAVVCARPQFWGNPYAHRDPAVAVRAYRGLFLGQYGKVDGLQLVGRAMDLHRVAVLVSRLGELRGKDLACWCRLCPDHAHGRPLGSRCEACAPCHCDALLELANLDQIYLEDRTLVGWLPLVVPPHRLTVSLPVMRNGDEGQAHLTYSPARRGWVCSAGDLWPVRQFLGPDYACR